jgi:acyl-coenzyme A thioesterase 9
VSGKDIRYGKIIEELDALAGDCSYKYLLKDDHQDNFNPETRPYTLVTVSVDRIDFMDKLSANKDLRLSAYMLMAKGSTLMVKIDVL